MDCISGESIDPGSFTCVAPELNLLLPTANLSELNPNPSGKRISSVRILHTTLTIADLLNLNECKNFRLFGTVEGFGDWRMERDAARVKGRARSVLVAMESEKCNL